MLNLEKITTVMNELSLNQSAIAEQCEVSREAVSNWLSGQSSPRPLKLKALAKALGLSLVDLVKPRERHPAPVVAYRTQRRVPVTEESLKAAEELAHHLRELVPFVFGETFFVPPHLDSPRVDDDYIRKVTTQIRARKELTPLAPISREHLLDMHHAFGSILIPVLWNGERTGHENALSVYLPESKSSWVVLSLNARNDDFNYWLAHELGHCYSLHALRDESGESFSERFAQELLFPYEAALEALDKFSTCGDAMAHAEYLAKMYSISIVTVIRQVDRVANQLDRPKCGLETPEFWATWNANRHLIPTVAQSLFGPDELTSESYVESAEKYFNTPIFKAIAQWQINEGGRSPAFIASALNIGLTDAYVLSKTLMKHC
jgi:transcriptional regulator with XRE-family HTH domain